MATVPQSLLDWFYKTKIPQISDPNAVYGRTSDTGTNTSNQITPIVNTNTGQTSVGRSPLGKYSTTPSTPTSTTDTTTPTTTDNTGGMLSSVTMPESAIISPNAYTPAYLNAPTQWNVTPQQTVQGQLQGILAKGGSLMQQARTTGLQLANRRGLLNSSMAIGSAYGEVLKQALPIAQADASMYGQAAQYNTNAENAFATTNQQVANAANQFSAEAANRAAEYNATNRFNEYQNQFTQQQQLFQANVDASLRQIDNEYNFTQQSQNLFAQLGDTFMKAITQINQDPNMDQQSKDYSINQMYQAYRANISLLSAVGSIPDVSVLLDFTV